MRIYRGCSTAECDSIRSDINAWPGSRLQKYSHRGIRNVPTARFTPRKDYAAKAPQEPCLLTIDTEHLEPTEWCIVDDHIDIDVLGDAVLRLARNSMITMECPT